MKRIRGVEDAGFTVPEMLVVFFVIALLAIVLLPALQKAKGGPGPVNCASNLKQVGVAFLLWSGDNNNNYPQKLAGSPAYPLINSPNPEDFTRKGTAWSAPENTCPAMYTVFLSMSNELSNPNIIACPFDKGRSFATNFATDLFMNKNAKVSYFIGKDADDRFPQMILAGDRNMSGDTANRVSPYGYSPSDKGVYTGFIKAIGTNITSAPLNGAKFGWTAKMHKTYGNAAFADGSVRPLDPQALKAAMENSGDTNAPNQNVLLFP